MKKLLAAIFSVFVLSLKLTAQDLPLSQKIITKKTVVNCPVEKAWWKWTTHEGLKTFFGQDNQMELRIGGPFEIYFSTDAPAGSRGSEGCKVLSYLPDRMLSFSWNAPPQFAEIRSGDYHTWVVIRFAEAADGKKTEVELSHLGWPDSKEWDEVHDYFDKAWGYVFKWFEESCQSK